MNVAEPLIQRHTPNLRTSEPPNLQNPRTENLENPENPENPDNPENPENPENPILHTKCPRGLRPACNVARGGDLAKRTTRKQSKTRNPKARAAARKSAPRRKVARRTGATKTAAKRTVASKPAAKRTVARKPAAKRTGAIKKTAARGTQSKAARLKNAARSAATRSIRREAKPKEPSRLASAAAAVKGAMAGAVAAVARRMPGATSDMDAITLLETDHRRLEDLLKQGEETTERAVKGRTQLLKTITAALDVHELIEEKLLYPALKRYPEARDIVLEGFEEHHVADLIVKELHDVSTDDEQWGAKFKVLKENIEHHIKEEEGPMFRTARGVMSPDELQALGAQMAKMKRDAVQGRLPRESVVGSR